MRREEALPVGSRLTAPSVAEPSENVTEPVGAVEVAEDGAMVALTVTLVPAATDPDEAVMAVLVGVGGTTVTVTEPKLRAG